MFRDSPGVMKTYLQLKTMSDEIDQPGQDFLQDHPQPSKEELRQRATKVTKAIAPRSIDLKMEAINKTDPDKALEELKQAMEDGENLPRVAHHGPGGVGSHPGRCQGTRTDTWLVDYTPRG